MVCFYYYSGWLGGWVAGSAGNKAISAFNWVEVEVEAELGKKLDLAVLWTLMLSPAPENINYYVVASSTKVCVIWIAKN